MDLVEGFERYNSVKIGFGVTLEGQGNTQALAISAVAFPRGVVTAEPVPLASVQLTTLPMNQKTLLGVLTHVLYALDFRIAASEFASVGKTA